MTRVTAFIVRHPVPAYFALTFGISWGGALAAIGGSRGMTGATPADDPRFFYAVIAMVAGPGIAGILMTALVERREGLGPYLSRALRWRAAPRWYAVALLTAPLLWAATLFALSFASPAFRPGILTSPDKGGLVLVGLAVASAAGVFEELGWTGFAIPHIRRRYSLFTTGVTVGVLWAAWHLLTNVFWASSVSAGELPLSIFLPVSVAGLLVGYLTAFRVLMVWLNDRTGSLWLAMLMHASLTATVLILDPVRLTGTALLTYSFSLAAAVWVAVALIATRSGRHAAERSLRRLGEAA